MADAGYRNERDLRELEHRGIDGYEALGWEERTAPLRRPRVAATQCMVLKLDKPPGLGTYANLNGW